MASYNSPEVEHKVLEDLVAMKKLFASNAQLDPSNGNTDIPEKAIRVIRKYIDDGTKYDGIVLEEYVKDQWQTLERLVMDADTLDGFHAHKTSTAENIIPVFNAAGKIAGGAEGEAGSARKLSKAVKIDIGGLITAEGENFDGSNDITIQVKQISVNNENDTAINGTLSKLHGGTGRTDGVATDVLVGAEGSNEFASKYGQIGKAADISGVDLDTITVSGTYFTYETSVDNHYPVASSGVVTIIRVASYGTYIHQMLVSESAIYVRISEDSGASWGVWNTVTGGSIDAVTIYVSKSGSDDNSGFDEFLPVMTLEKAIEIGAKNAPISMENAVTLCVGEGEWGDIELYDLPCAFRILPYDGKVAAEFVETLPTFGTIKISNSEVFISGVNAASILATRNSFVGLSDYFRFAELRSEDNAFLVANTEVAEIRLKSDHQAVFFTDTHGSLIFNSCTFTVIENISLLDAFFAAYGNSVISYTGEVPKFSLDEVTVVGKRYNLGSYGGVNLGINLKESPGSEDGTAELNCLLNGLPRGDGEERKFLSASGDWTLIKTSDDIDLDDPDIVASSKAVHDLNKKIEEDMPAPSNEIPPEVLNGKIGESSDYARADHSHDIGSHASNDQKYGIGTAIDFGHVRLTDNFEEDFSAKDGVAATPKGIKNAWDRIMGLTQETIFTTSGSWTVPETGAYAITCVGGGGNGGDGGYGCVARGKTLTDTTTLGAAGGGGGGGGGAGQIASRTVNLTKNQIISFTIGAAGGTTTVTTPTATISAVGGGNGFNGANVQVNPTNFSYTAGTCNGVDNTNFCLYGMGGAPGVSYGTPGSSGTDGSRKVVLLAGSSCSKVVSASGGTGGVGGESNYAPYGNGGDGGDGGSVPSQTPPNSGYTVQNVTSSWGGIPYYGSAGSKGNPGCVVIRLAIG